MSVGNAPSTGLKPGAPSPGRRRMSRSPRRAASGATDRPGRALDEALATDRDLRRLQHRNAGVDRALGRGIARIVESRDHLQLGFPRAIDFFREHLHLCPGRARRLRALDRAVRALPEAAAALEDGRLSASHVIELGRVVKEETPAEERRAWLERAERSTVRELQTAIKGARPAVSTAAETDDEEGRFVSIGAPAALLELWPIASDLAEKVSGYMIPPHARLEVIVAEFFSKVGDVGTPATVPAPAPAAEPSAPIPPVPGSGRAERWPDLEWSPPVGRDEDLDMIGRAQDAFALADRLRELSRGRAVSRLELAAELEEMKLSHGYQLLGFRSFGEYCEQRLGFTGRHAEKLIHFKRSLAQYDHLREAYQAGAIGYSAARQLLPILCESNEEAWVAWARQVSVRDLQRAVEHAALYARPAPPGDGLARANTSAPEATGLPSLDDPFAGLLARANTLAPEEEDARADEMDGTEDAELALLPEGHSLPPLRPRGRPRIAGLSPDDTRRPRERVVGRIRFWAPTETARQLERALLRARQILGGDGPDWQYFQVILAHFIETQDTPTARRHIVQFRAMVRDDFLCQCPTCTCRRHLHEHHVQYQSHGGGDELSNLATFCAGHHLFGEHAGTTQVGGWAPDNLFIRVGLRPRPADDGSTALQSFHGGLRADDAFVREALACWRIWCRLYQNRKSRALALVPTARLTRASLAALRKALVREMWRPFKLEFAVPASDDRRSA